MVEVVDCGDIADTHEVPQVVAPLLLFPVGGLKGSVGTTSTDRLGLYCIYGCTRAGGGLGLEEIFSCMEGGVLEVNASDCIDPVGGGFGTPLDPLEERLYLLVQVNHGSPCRQQVPGAHGGQERREEQRVYQFEGGNVGSGDGNTIGGYRLIGDPWCDQ